MDLLVISGLSGGGKSTALRALEDLGMYCTDNVPIPLVPQLVKMVRESDDSRPVAVGVDARDRQYLERFADVHQELVDSGLSVEVVFVEASRSVLVQRYSATRRLHPMGQLPEGIDRERELLAPIREVATLSIDTTNLNTRQLRQLVRDRYAASGSLRVALVSFGYRAGLPAEADVVLDARFLTNPYEVPELRALSGLHEPVSRYVIEQPDAKELLAHAERLLRFLAPRVAAEGRSYLTVAIGCTGGQHRSVALVEALKARLEAEPVEAGAGKPRLLVRHRDVGQSS